MTNPEETNIQTENPRSPGSVLLLTAGLLTWAMIAVPYIYRVAAEGATADVRWATWLAAHLLFGVLLCACFGVRILSYPASLERRRKHRLLVFGQAVCALVAVAAQSSGLTLILLVVVASQVPLSSSLRVSLVWIAVQTAIGAPLAFGGLHIGRLIVETGTYVGFQLFAVYASSAAVREQRARQNLAETNAELMSTRELLASSSRLAERRRISRELHDLLGHHLTALSLQLEAAAHLAEGRAAEKVSEARELAGELLDDVRRAVRSFRADNSVDLAPPLELLANAIPEPQVHLQLPESLAIEDPVRANAVLRSAQEMVTNAARHSSASNLWLTLSREPEGLRIAARDDGRGAAPLRYGSGLRGLEERLGELGGRLQVSSSAGEGFELDAWLPIQEQRT